MQTRTHRVLDIRDLGGGSFVLSAEGPFPRVSAGQFCMLQTERGWPVQLPRPFSYFDAREDRASFFGKVVGPGTRSLFELREGDGLVVTGPLGQYWPSVRRGAAEPVCIAGGVGLAPFLLWTRERAAAGAGKVPLLYGGATEAAIVGHEDFDDGAQEFHLATDDGSKGFAGNVLELYRSLVEHGEIDRDAPVYCCGPDPMMHAVAAHCRAQGTACFVSLETYMACGFGVCNGCSVEVQDQGRFAGKVYAKTCIAGPVFAADELRW